MYLRKLKHSIHDQCVCILLVLNIPCTLLAVVANFMGSELQFDIILKKEGILFLPVTISTTHCQLYVDSQN